jgi:hypothetical protein
MLWAASPTNYTFIVVDAAHSVLPIPTKKENALHSP